MSSMGLHSSMATSAAVSSSSGVGSFPRIISSALCARMGVGATAPSAIATSSTNPDDLSKVNQRKPVKIKNKKSKHELNAVIKIDDPLVDQNESPNNDNYNLHVSQSEEVD